MLRLILFAFILIAWAQASHAKPNCQKILKKVERAHNQAEELLDLCVFSETGTCKTLDCQRREALKCLIKTLDKQSKDLKLVLKHKCYKTKTNL